MEGTRAPLECMCDSELNVEACSRAIRVVVHCSDLFTSQHHRSAREEVKPNFKMFGAKTQRFTRKATNILI